MTLAVFWGMALCVFLQFFTRYVLNNSLAWTEEIAINCLVVVVFLGSVWCVRQSRHIQVDVLYHYLPPGVARALSTLVDLIRIGFFAYASLLLWRYVGIVAARAHGHDRPAAVARLLQRLRRLRADARCARSRWRSATGGAAIRCSSAPSAFDGFGELTPWPC